MTAYRRAYHPGGCYFFTLVTEHRRPLLIAEIDPLRRAFRLALERRPVTLDAIVVPPDHLHTLWRLPDGDADYATRWMHIKRLFSARFAAQPSCPSQAHKREKGIWQRRYWEHVIRDETDWHRHMDYIHYNPVKHGLCAAPIDWPQSSFRRAVAEGLYAADWGATRPGSVEGLELE
jgi:putative transposase